MTMMFILNELDCNKAKCIQYQPCRNLCATDTRGCCSCDESVSQCIPSCAAQGLPPAATLASKAPRVAWSDRETMVLIDLWEEHFDDLRRQKRNGAVYLEIARRLQYPLLSQLRRSIRGVAATSKTVSTAAVNFPYW